MEEKYLLQLKKDKNIQAVYQFGSYGTKRYNPHLSDRDFCIFTISKSKVDLLKYYSFGGGKRDISVFDHLPIYLKLEVFRGKPLFVRNKAFIARKFAVSFREYQDFKKYQERYWERLKKRRKR